MFRNGHLGRSCPTCGRDCGEVERPVMFEDGISSIPFCSTSCRATYAASRSGPNRSVNKNDDNMSDEEWRRWEKSAENMHKAMK